MPPKKIIETKKLKARKTAVQRDAAGINPRFAPIVAAFAKDRQVKCGRMFSSNSVLNVKGKIFAMLNQGNLVVKLPKPRVDDLVGSGKGKRFDPGHGRLMKEWIAIGPGQADWIEMAREAHHFVKGGGK